MIKIARSLIKPEVVAGLGLGLSSLTALRFGDLPVGPSELLFVVAFIGFIFSNGIRISNSLNIFWFLSFILLSIGYFLSVLGAGHDLYAITQDVVSLLFAYMVSIAVYIAVTSRDRDVFLSVIVFASTAVLVFILITAVLFGIGWESGARLYGFSKNPNQLAFFCLVSLLTAGAYLDVENRSFSRVLVAATLILLALIVGYYSSSDALIFSLILFVVSFMLLTAFIAPVRSYWMGVIRLLVFFGILIIVLCALLNVNDLIEYFEAVADEGEQGSIRFVLWSNGVDAVMQSPIWGWGPGAWSGLSGPLQGAEAHNTYIDWATKTGVVGLALLLYLNLSVLYLLFRAKKVFFASCLVGIFTFSVFHLVIRQPGYWFVLSYCLAFSLGVRKLSNSNKVHVLE